MRLREATASALHLLVVLSYFTLAVFVVLLQRRLDWKKEVLDAFMGDPQLFYWVGLGLAAVGLVFLLGFFRVGRGRYLRVGMAAAPVVIDAKLITRAIEECFKNNYPKQLLGANVIVSKGSSLEVSLDLVELSQKQQLELLSDAEKKLVELLDKRFGYSKPFSLVVRSG